MPGLWIVRLDPQLMKAAESPQTQAPSTSLKASKKAKTTKHSPIDIVKEVYKGKVLVKLRPNKGKHRALVAEDTVTDLNDNSPVLVALTEEQLQKLKADYPGAVVNQIKDGEVDLVTETQAPAFLTPQELIEFDREYSRRLAATQDASYANDEVDPIANNGIDDRDLNAGKGMIIGVMDTGIEVTSEFGSRVLPGVNFSPEGARTDISDSSTSHGSWVASKILGSQFGLAPSANLLLLKIFATGAQKNNVSSILEAMSWLVEYRKNYLATNPNAFPFMLINMSIAFSLEFQELFDDLISQAKELGIIFVVAAGNARMDACNSLPSAFSAKHSNVITIGGLDTDLSMYSNSNYGQCVQYFARAVSSRSSAGVYTGTSMAAPEATGVIANILQQLVAENPRVTLDQALTAIDQASYDVMSTTDINFGNLPAFAAAIKKRIVIPQKPLSQIDISSRPLLAPTALTMSLEPGESVQMAFQVNGYAPNTPFQLAVLSDPLPYDFDSYTATHKISKDATFSDPNFNGRKITLNEITKDGVYWFRLRLQVGKDGVARHLLEVGTGSTIGSSILATYNIDAPVDDPKKPLTQSLIKANLQSIVGINPLRQIAFQSTAKLTVVSMQGFEPYEARSQRPARAPTPPPTNLATIYIPPAVAAAIVKPISKGQCYYAQFLPKTGGSEITFQVQTNLIKYKIKDGAIINKNGKIISIPKLKAGTPIRFKIQHTGKDVKVSVITSSGVKLIDTFKSGSINKMTPTNIGFPLANTEFVEYGVIQKCTLKPPAIHSAQKTAPGRSLSASEPIVFSAGSKKPELSAAANETTADLVVNFLDSAKSENVFLSAALGVAFAANKIRKYFKSEATHSSKTLSPTIEQQVEVTRIQSKLPTSKQEGTVEVVAVDMDDPEAQQHINAIDAKMTAAAAAEEKSFRSRLS